MIFADSGAWFASVIPTDADHAVVTEWFSQNREPLLTTAYVVDETLTLFVARGQKPRAVAFGKAMMTGGLAALHYVRPDEFEAA